jgi:hypothetical protein
MQLTNHLLVMVTVKTQPTIFETYKQVQLAVLPQATFEFHSVPKT